MGRGSRQSGQCRRQCSARHDGPHCQPRRHMGELGTNHRCRLDGWSARRRTRRGKEASGWIAFSSPQGIPFSPRRRRRRSSRCIGFSSGPQGIGAEAAGCRRWRKRTPRHPSSVCPSGLHCAGGSGWGCSASWCSGQHPADFPAGGCTVCSARAGCSQHCRPRPGSGCAGAAGTECASWRLGPAAAAGLRCPVAATAHVGCSARRRRLVHAAGRPSGVPPHCPPL